MLFSLYSSIVLVLDELGRRHVRRLIIRTITFGHYGRPHIKRFACRQALVA